MRFTSLSLTLLLLASLLVACGDDDATTADSGVADSGNEDSGAADSGTEDSGSLDAGECEMLPETIDDDMTVGPGCVRVYRTRVTGDATLTIVAGTRVLMASDGFLHVSPFGDGSALVAIGTASKPIVFTSESSSPLAGDWECVHITGSSSQSEIRHAVFEYGGNPCSTTGADHEGMLQINSSARAVSNVTFRNSRTYGVFIQNDGGVREFQDNTFSDNMQAGIRIAAPQLLALGTGLTFEDDNDRIEVDSTFSLDTTGTIRGQSVPFRISSGLSFRGGAEVTLEAGVVFAFTGNSLDVFSANIITQGTADKPVVFTSAAATPTAGDWGCITMSSLSGTPRFDHTRFEYAGNGAGCTGAERETALDASGSDNTVITNCTFSHIAGSAIQGNPCQNAAWCMNTFEDVEVGPLACDFGPVITACL